MSIQPITETGHKWFPLELLDFNTAHYLPKVSINHLLTTSIGRSQKVATVTIA